MKEIRPYKHEDLEALALLGFQFAQEYGLPSDLDSVRDSIINITNHPDSAALVAIDDGKLVGAIGGMKIASIFSKSLVQMNELMWFIKPEYRGTKLGFQLLQAFEMMAKRLGCHWVIMISPEALNSQALHSLYTKTDYVKFETLYKKEI